MRKFFLLWGSVALLGLLGWSQFSGEWTAQIYVVPNVSLKNCELTIKYAMDANWIISSMSKFDETGLVDQSFGFTGAFGPLSLSGGMAFNPTVMDTIVVFYPQVCGGLQTVSYTLTAPAYKEAWAKATFALAGLELGTEFHHWAYPYHQEDIDEEVESEEEELEYYWPCCPPQTGSYTLFVFFVGLPPFKLEIDLADCCSGLGFSEALLSLTDVGLCCGLSYDAELYFTKAGFGYFEMAVELSVCCGISVEVATRFTVDHKRVTVTPKWNGLGQACFIVYGDIVTDQTQNWRILGLEIYGYKLYCDLSKCSHIEFMTAFDVEKLEDLLDEDIFEEDEFEYWKIAFCGPGCCGGMYTLGLAAFFQRSGSLFGLTRIKGDLSVPIMANFDLLLSLSVSLSGGTELAVGWTFRF